MGEDVSSANPTKMLRYRTATTEQVGRWTGAAPELRAALTALRGAMSQADLPDEARVHVPLHEDAFDTLTADQRHLDSWVGEVAEGFLAVKGIDYSGGKLPPPQVLEVPDSRIHVGAADRTEAPDESTVKAVEANPATWRGLDRETRERLVKHWPFRIGRINGVPTEARHEANMIALQRSKKLLNAEKAALNKELPALQRAQDPRKGTEPAEKRLKEIQARLATINERLGGFAAIERRINQPVGQGTPPAFLMGFNPEGGHGRAIVAIGNPDEADNVATYVPGTKQRVSGYSMSNNIGRADIMAADAREHDPSTSVIMWLDYHAPQTVFPGSERATKEDYARNAAGSLRGFQRGLDVSHIGGDANRTMVGHSYGSTVIGHAAKGGGLNNTDSAVFVGSPGVGVDHVNELGLNSNQVYATTGRGDPILWTPPWIHDKQPVANSFGAKRFPSAPGGHGSNWSKGNPARRNMAAIITGNHGQVEVIDYEPIGRQPTVG